ncbi:MAG TPA: sigma 54-interacting transcriptional regulator [bacterium]|jgi:DNA-binding NtrC family response regulator
MESRRLDIRHTFETVIANSSAMRQVVATAKRLAADSRPTFVDGAEGTGRKFMARVMHQEGPRSAHPIVTVRCDLLTVNVLDRTLFGDERTGTVGKFEESADGTLLLTDLEDLNPVSQERLNKVLELGRFTTGDYETRIITSRLISTGNRSEIEKLMQSGQFSQPLFARLTETTLCLPSLSERHQDIPDLVVNVLRELSSRERIEMPAVPYHYMELLMNVAWPENVRQLRNHIESVMVLSGGEFNPEIIREHFVPEGTPATIKGAFQTLLSKLRVTAAEPTMAVNHNR